MGILKKSVIGISLMLVIVFSIMALGINIAVRQNSESLVSSIIAALEENSDNTVRTLNKNFEKIENELENADQTTQKIILELYNTSYNSLAQTVANQIFPMIENFDYDAAGGVVTSLLKTIKEVKWIKYVTSKNPTASDTYEFGQKASDDSKTFTHEISDEFSYMKIEMQVSLTGIQATKDVEGLFSKINKENQELASYVEYSSKQSLTKRYSQ